MNLQIQNLSKTYANGVRALDRVSLDIGPGMFGLLGPNGAGKSTLMNTLATLQEADSGTVTLGEFSLSGDPVEIRRRLGYLPQDFGVYPGTSAWDMLDYIAQIKGISDRQSRYETVATLLERVNLTDAARRNLDTYSGGMRQRFGIAQALVGNPDLIIVDEPTAGLDPAERNRFHHFLSEIGTNTIVILSTHIVEDVSTLCRDMAILDGGKVVAQGSPESLRGELEGKVWQKEIERGELAKWESDPRTIMTRLHAGRIRIVVGDESSPSEGFSAKHPDLEDVYFQRLKQSHSTEAAA